VQSHTEPGAGHGLTQNDLTRLAGWIAELTSDPAR
jgi:hypothetical protein